MTEATMDREHDLKLPKVFTVEEAAGILQQTPRRVRQWGDLGILEIAYRVGRVQFTRRSLLRAVVLQELQALWGTASNLAVELAKAIEPEQLDALPEASDPRVTAVIGDREYSVAVDPQRIADAVERMRGIAA